jgi:hypothetical protein
LLLKNVTENALLILTVTTGVMVVGRAFAGPVVHKLSPQGVYWFSHFSNTSLYMLGHTSGNMLFVGALVFGAGMLFLAMYAWFCFRIFAKNRCRWYQPYGWCRHVCRIIIYNGNGGVYDNLILKQLPPGADLKAYNADEASQQMKEALAAANKAAGPEVINTTLVIPIILIVAFTILF